MMWPNQQPGPLKLDLTWGQGFLLIADGGSSSHLGQSFQSYDGSKEGDLVDAGVSPQESTTSWGWAAE